MTIGITLGDPAGIGPEVIEAALKSGQLDPECHYRVIGTVPDDVVPGQASASSARAAWEAMEESVRLLQRGQIQAVATGPICKKALADLGYPYPGQTEFYADKLGVDNIAMMLTGPRLTVSLVTWHIPLMRVREHLSQAEIVRVARLTLAHCLKVGIDSPRIAIAGLNPHAGECGLLGAEEIELVIPAVTELENEWPGFSGPYPPDTLFFRAARGEFDAVVCLYHDQGLIPLKLLDFDQAVNVTLGLPQPRTSPDHGTAFDIAGQGRANPASMLAAIQLAARLVT
jgi:4-hydroxythreonine-4-phosphate dehydrogenase